MHQQNVDKTSLSVIGATSILPVDSEQDDIHTNFGIVIENETILEIAPYDVLCNKYPEAHHEFFPDHIILPGLINCHGHAAMSLLRGLADDYPLMEWLESHIWPAETKWVDYAFVRDGTSLAIAEMLLSGTTTFSDMYFFPEASASASESLGINAQINFPIIEFPSNWSRDSEESIKKGLDVYDQYRNSKNVSIGFAPHSPYTVSNTSFEKIITLAEEVDTHIQLHLHETEIEITNSLNDHGCRPIERLNNLGLFSPRVQAVHFTQFNSDDITIIKNNNTSIIHCPTSNQKLASGYCNINELLRSDIKTGLGTDGAASNNTLDLFESLRTAALQAKLQTRDATVLNAKTALKLATLGGAEALGIDDQTGSLTIGKKADLIAIDTRKPSMQPMYNPFSLIAYTQAGSAVSEVWINGKRKVKQGQLTDIDLNQLLNSVSGWQQKIIASMSKPN